MKSMRARVVLLALAVTLLAGVASAQNAGDTERKLRELRKELKQIGSERRKLEGQRGEAIARCATPMKRWAAPRAH